VRGVGQPLTIPAFRSLSLVNRLSFLDGFEHADLIDLRGHGLGSGLRIIDRNDVTPYVEQEFSLLVLFSFAQLSIRISF
jgi:hypothetical protein